MCLSSLYMSVVCPGTQNGLSSTGSQEIQYNLIKDRYDGCEIIMGNLEITQIESNWDFSFLKVNIILFLSPLSFNWFICARCRSALLFLPCRQSARWLAMSSSPWTTFRRFLWGSYGSSEETAFMRDALLSLSSWTTPRTAPTACDSWGSQIWQVDRVFKKYLWGYLVLGPI